MNANIIQEWWGVIRREFQAYSIASFQKDLLAGLTVAAVALPLALAFGVASGADAAAGVVTAILGGVLIALLGGAPYQVSGPTGAMSAVLIVLVSRHGLQGVWMAGLMSGIFILLLGLFRLGRIVALIPAPVITGFTSGIAVLIAFGQIDNALGLTGTPAESVLDKLRLYSAQGIHPDADALLVTVPWWSASCCYGRASKCWRASPVPWQPS
jgi:SulP family sulfate permease